MDHPPNFVSPSMLNLWEDCNYAYYLHYIQNEELISAYPESLKIGLSGHKILQFAYDFIDVDKKDPDEAVIDGLKISAQHYWDRSINAEIRSAVSKNLFLWASLEGSRLKRFKEANKKELFKPIITEGSFKGNGLNCKIDKVQRTIDGRHYAIDYKFSPTPDSSCFLGQNALIPAKYKNQAVINYLVLLPTPQALTAGFYFQFMSNPEKLMAITLDEALITEVKKKIETLRGMKVFNKTTDKKKCYLCGLKDACESYANDIYTYPIEII